MKSLKLGDVVWADDYRAKITKITDDGVVGLVLDEGLITEFHYECLLGDITLDNDGDWVLDTEFVPVVGDYILDNDIDISKLKILFHTANPVGRLNMMCYWANFKENYERGITK